MKVLFGPVQIVALVLAIAGIFLGQSALVALGVVGWLGAAAVGVIKQTGAARNAPELKPESRILIRPLEDLRNDILKLVEENRTNASVTVVGREALNEADELIRRAETFAASLGNVKKTKNALYESQKQIELLSETLAKSQSEKEKESLRQAIGARQEEAASMQKALDSVDATRAKIKDAEGELQGIKSQLTTAALTGQPDSLDTEGLSGMVGRIRSLSSSIEEAEGMKERT